MSTPFGVIRNAYGERLDVAYQPPAAGSTDSGPDGVPRDIVVLGHGVTSNKDRPWLMMLSDALATAGIASLRFSFAGNGGSEGRFEEATLSKEVEDLGSVLGALEARGVARIAYAGHSMGGAIGVLRASRDPRIACLVSLAGMVHVHEFMQRHLGHLAPGEAMFDKPECPWSRALADDAARIGSLTSHAARIQVPWLLVHGDADDLVPVQDSLDACEAAGDRPTLVTLGGIDHRFTDAIPHMVDVVVPWLKVQFHRAE